MSSAPHTRPAGQAHPPTRRAPGQGADARPALLASRRILVTGVLTPRSLGFGVARAAQEAGASVILSSFGRAWSMTERCARSLPEPVEMVHLDMADEGDFEDLGGEVERRWQTIDGVVHAVAFAPPECIGGAFTRPRWDDVATTLRVSAYSLKALAEALAPRMGPGSGIVALGFDTRVVYPEYNWMGVAKSMLASVARHLAVELGPRGIRVNVVVSGPVRTMSATRVPGFDDLSAVWADRAPLGWDDDSSDATARACVALLSDWFPATTGEEVRVDGGFHVAGG